LFFAIIRTKNELDAGRLTVENAAPIVLMFDKSVSEVSLLLSELVETDDEMFHYEGAASVGSAFRLLSRGIEYSVSADSSAVDITHFDRIFCACDLSNVGAMLKINFGSNVAGGRLMAPIALNLLMFAAKLATAIGAVAVAWLPSRLLSDVGYFASAVEAYADGGAFPVLSTIKLEFADDSLRTTGLSWFSEQELELRGAGLPRPELMRRAVRIVHDIAANGPVMVSQNVPDLDEERVVQLSLSSNGRLVCAEVTSSLDLAGLVVP
jgi:hypothetical protein